MNIEYWINQHYGTVAAIFMHISLNDNISRIVHDIWCILVSKFTKGHRIEFSHLKNKKLDFRAALYNKVYVKMK